MDGMGGSRAQEGRDRRRKTMVFKKNKKKVIVEEIGVAYSWTKKAWT